MSYTYTPATQLYANVLTGSGAPYYTLEYAGKPVYYSTDIHPSFYNAMYGGASEVLAFLRGADMGLWYSPSAQQYYIGYQSDNPFTAETDPYNSDIPTPSSCFIATACYGTSMHADLDVLRRFRDEKMPVGLTAFYYRHSPPIARFIARHRLLRWLIRQPIKLAVRCLHEV